MAEVQSIGAVDYQMPVVQPQDKYVEEVPADIDNSPMVYDPEIEAKRGASAKMLGLTALGLIAIGGLGYWAGHSAGKKSVNGDELNKLKDAAQEIYNESKEVSEECFGGFFNGKKFAKNTQEKLKPFVKDAEEAAKDSEKKA